MEKPTESGKITGELGEFLDAKRLNDSVIIKELYELYNLARFANDYAVAFEILKNLQEKVRLKD